MRSARSLLVVAMLAACDDGAGEPDVEGTTAVEDASSGDLDEASSTDPVPVPTTDTEASTSSTGVAESSSTGEPASDCPPDSFLTATNFGMPFMTTWCTGCHSSDLVGPTERQMAPEQFDFDDLESVRAHADFIAQDAAGTNVLMPPAGGPTDQERMWLAEWIACGAP
jgi:hypothetical protein